MRARRKSARDSRARPRHHEHSRRLANRGHRDRHAARFRAVRSDPFLREGLRHRRRGASYLRMPQARRRDSHTCRTASRTRRSSPRSSAATAVMGGNARVGVEMVAPGKIVHLSTGHIDFGELDGRETDRARKIADVFQRAGILGQVSADIMTLRWDKLIWNGAVQHGRDADPPSRRRNSRRP